MSSAWAQPLCSTAAQTACNQRQPWQEEPRAKLKVSRYTSISKVQNNPFSMEIICLGIYPVSEFCRLLAWEWMVWEATAVKSIMIHYSPAWTSCKIMGGASNIQSPAQLILVTWVWELKITTRQFLSSFGRQPALRMSVLDPRSMALGDTIVAWGCVTSWKDIVNQDVEFLMVMIEHGGRNCPQFLEPSPEILPSTHKLALTILPLKSLVLSHVRVLSLSPWPSPNVANSPWNYHVLTCPNWPFPSHKSTC